MGFFMIYNRRIPDASIVDTLLLYVYTNQVNSNLPTYSFTGKYPQDNFGVDTLSFKATLYNKTMLPSERHYT
jgi:hypothetical protein